MSTGDDSINSIGIFFVPFLSTREAMVLLAKDLMISGTSIQSFRHLKHQNMSTSDDFIHSSGIYF